MEEPTYIDTAPKPKKEFSLIIKAFIILIKLLGYSLALVITAALFAGITSMLAPDLNPEDLQEGDISDWKSMSIIYIGILLGTFLITWVFRVAVDQQPFETVGLKMEKVGTKLVKGALGAIGLLSIVFVILYAIGAVSIVDVQLDWVDLLGFLGFLFMAALVEELLFRGYMIPLIAKDFHFMAALLLSSLAFAALHISNSHFTWIAFGNIFLGGYLMAIIFYKQQDLYMPLGLHWFWNYYQGNILGFNISGQEIDSLFRVDMNGEDWLTGGDFGLEGSIVTLILLLIVSLWLTYKWYDVLLDFGREKREERTERQPC